MVKIMVIPEALYEQYKAEGVQFNRLFELNYLTDTATVGELVEIDEAIVNFPKDFLIESKIQLIDSPIGQLRSLVNDNVNDYSEYKSLLDEIKIRLETNELRENDSNDMEYNIYTLKPIDEYLWVAVQKSMHVITSDPVKESVKANHSFINDMIKKLLDVLPFELVAATSLFRMYLDSNVSKSHDG